MVAWQIVLYLNVTNSLDYIITVQIELFINKIKLKFIIKLIDYEKMNL